MDFEIIVGVILFVILISIQYTLNKVFIELKEIKNILMNIKIKN